MSRGLRRVWLWSAALLVAVGVVVVGERLDRLFRTRAAFRRNTPDILIADPHASTMFPDAMHVQLSDGRRFRLAHVDAGVGAFGIPPAPAAFWQIFHNGANVMAGLRTVGRSEDGEILVEPWVLRANPPWCGNATWLERRRGSIPQWQDMTWRLTDSGHYWLLLNADHQKPEAAAYQRMAIRDGNGLWRNPAFLRHHLDLRPYEVILNRVIDRHTNYQRAEAADVLLRADPDTFAPRLLTLVRDSSDRDVYFRVAMAQALERHGHPEGTQYWMDALRNGGVGTGLDQSSLNSVRNEYRSFWNVQDSADWSSSPGVVGHSEQQIQNAVTRPANRK